MTVLILVHNGLVMVHQQQHRCRPERSSTALTTKGSASATATGAAQHATPRASSNELTQVAALAETQSQVSYTSTHYWHLSHSVCSPRVQRAAGHAAGYSGVLNKTLHAATAALVDCGTHTELHMHVDM
jgi:hypothetical protein